MLRGNTCQVILFVCVSCLWRVGRVTTWLRRVVCRVTSWLIQCDEMTVWRVGRVKSWLAAQQVTISTYSGLGPIIRLRWRHTVVCLKPQISRVEIRSHKFVDTYVVDENSEHLCKLVWTSADTWPRMILCFLAFAPALFLLFFYCFSVNIRSYYFVGYHRPTRTKSR